MHELIDNLQRYHREKARVLSHMDGLISELEERDSLVRGELYNLVDSFRNEAEISHHHNEELILVELRRTTVPIHYQIENISEEHVAFGRIVERLYSRIPDSSIPHEVISSEVRWFLGQYDEHATVEEAIFFPAADKHLTPDAWLRVEKSWKS